jgi:hypothetical protein
MSLYDAAVIAVFSLPLVIYLIIGLIKLAELF